MTMRTVSVVFLVVDVELEASAEVVADGVCPIAVCVIVWVPVDVLGTGVAEIPTTLSD